MTKQLKDTIRYDGRVWEIEAKNGVGFFVPKAFGLRLRPASTACLRGYVADYEINNGSLTLKDLKAGFLSRFGDLNLSVIKNPLSLPLNIEFSGELKISTCDIINLRLKNHLPIINEDEISKGKKSKRFKCLKFEYGKLIKCENL